MKTTLLSVILFYSLVFSVFAQEKPTTADHLQNVSVTIRSEGKFSNGEGSGVIFTRKDAKGDQVNLCGPPLMLLTILDQPEKP